MIKENILLILKEIGLKKIFFIWHSEYHCIIFRVIKFFNVCSFFDGSYK